MSDEYCMTRETPDTADPPALTPDEVALGMALMKGDSAAAARLSQSGVDLNAVMAGTGLTPASYALMVGDSALLKAILDRGGDVNERDEFGREALHYAAGFGEGDKVRMLLDKGADVSAIDAAGQTPLHWAARGGDADTIRALIEHGADRSARDHSGALAEDLRTSQAGLAGIGIGGIAGSLIGLMIGMSAGGPMMGLVAALLLGAGGAAAGGAVEQRLRDAELSDLLGVTVPGGLAGAVPQVRSRATPVESEPSKDMDALARAAKRAGTLMGGARLEVKESGQSADPVRPTQSPRVPSVSTTVQR
ncbi:MAG: ankyrin repeat domain-containing protein [Phycisphaerales bacterium]|nr:ankyrin repeat domain-containing protein [Phycisphaerales bacterium]